MGIKKFALIGAGGYVAPRHMKAIKETGNDLVAAIDINDSVGILDSYFPDCRFFTEIEKFDRHLEKLRRKGEKIDYISVCSPNHLHDAHCRLGLRVDADIICEKPLVLSPWNIDQLKVIEEENNRKIYCILQLRLLPSLIKLKEEVKNCCNKFSKVNLRYITPRGHWYKISWKGNIEKSGGILTNIGIHFFDILIWIFGDCKAYEILELKDDRSSGILHFDNATVNWYLSTNINDSDNGKPYRSLTVDGEEIRFDNVFGDLHTEMYKNILDGKGFGIEECKPSIELVHKMRSEYGKGLYK